MTPDTLDAAQQVVNNWPQFAAYAFKLLVTNVFPVLVAWFLKSPVDMFRKKD